MTIPEYDHPKSFWINFAYILQQAKDFENVGADFFISPGFVPEVASYLIAKDLFYSPGCMTPTEIIAAENAGVKFIKLFPGNMLGPEFLSGIKDIFPKLLFMTKLNKALLKNISAMAVFWIKISTIILNLQRLIKVNNC